jgi:hypothetical protein
VLLPQLAAVTVCDASYYIVFEGSSSQSAAAAAAAAGTSYPVYGSSRAVLESLHLLLR